MFEKEAEKWVKTKGTDAITCLKENIGWDDVCKQAFKEGAEFGYNKANEWHYVKDGDLPKPTTPVLVILESGVPYVSWISSDKGWWFCTNYYTGEDKVIAWKEIVLPELKEDE